MYHTYPPFLQWYGFHLPGRSVIDSEPSEEAILSAQADLASNPSLPLDFTTQREVRLQTLARYFSRQQALPLFRKVLQDRRLTVLRGEILEAIIIAHPDWVQSIEGYNPLHWCRSNLAAYTLLCYGAPVQVVPNKENLESNLRLQYYWGLRWSDLPFEALQPLLTKPSFLSLLSKQGPVALIESCYQYLTTLSKLSSLELYFPILTLLQNGLPSASLHIRDAAFHSLAQSTPIVTFSLPLSVTERKEITLPLGFEEGRGFCLTLLLRLSQPEAFHSLKVKLLGTEKATAKHDYLALYGLSELEMLPFLGGREVLNYSDLLYCDYSPESVRKALPAKAYIIDLVSEIGLYRVQADSLAFVRGALRAAKLLEIRAEELISRLQHLRFD